MKVLTGIDAVEISRIKKSMKNPSFLKKLLGPQEYKYYEKKHFPEESIAAAFCAKEAFSKVMGTGLTGGFDLTEVEVLHDILGKPYYSFSGKAAKMVKKKRLKFDLTITHTGDTAFAVATATKKFF